MYLKTLTIRGFKSFASATTFEFEPGVTAVVGPNGSGKSNVVDALAWVMGEQGAKTLRGGKMEDVIFAGTSERQALGRAQVTLTIDNTDGALPIEYSEVTISRTLFRSGGSEYAINGSPVRLLDLQELLSDSGLGREMHVIVGQGQLDRVLHATPEDRRGFIEEAAGILKHRRRKEKTLRKLDSTQANLDRLEDLTKELARQLGPLGRQAATARRARTVQSRLRDARSRLLADDLAQVMRAQAEGEAEATLLAQRRSVATAGVDAARESLVGLEAAVAQATPVTAAARQTWYELSRLGERFRALQSLASERRRLLGAAEPVPAGREDAESLDRRADEAKQDAARAGEQVGENTTLLDEAVRLREAAEGSQREEDARLTALLRAVADRREGLARLAGQVGTARQRVESAEGERERAQQRETEAEERRQAALAEREPLAAAAEATLVALMAPTAAVPAARAELEEARAAIRTARQAVGPAAERRAGLAARLAALEELQPVSQGAGALLTGLEAGLLGRLADLVQVQPGMEAALQAALQGAEHAIVVEGADLIREVAARSAAGEQGQVRLLGGPGAESAEEAVGSATASGASTTRSVADSDGYAAPLVASMVRVNEDLAPLLEQLLGGTLLAPDDDRARALASEGHVAVTPAGNRWDATGLTIGSPRDAAGLSRRAAAESTREELQAAVVQETQARQALADLEPLERAAALRLREAEEALRHASEASRHAGGALERVEAAARYALADTERAKTEADRAEKALLAAAGALTDLTSRLEAAQAVPDEGEPSTAERDRLAAQAAVARHAEVEAKLALRTAEENHRRAQDRERSLRRAAQAERQARQEAEARATRRATRAARAERVASLAASGGSRLAVSETLAKEAVDAAQARERELAGELEASRAVLSQAEAELARIAELAHSHELAATERAARFAALQERALHELAMTPDYLVGNFGPDLPVPPDPEEESQDKWAALRQEVDDNGNPVAGAPYVRAEQERRLKRAERDLSALGKVNPLALEEFAALEERHGYLNGQLADLRKSRQDLLELVREVDEHVRVVFKEAFEDTAREFEKVFSRLFPGGEGRLRLTEPGDMLTTGIEVEARPAGKKIKRLSLLSGGERSLTALALLVAIFTARPSPFYVMDEVEAALDERNLLRLLDVFSDLRQHSQLIIITHQKHTMNIADALYGVSMRGDGVTHVISQRLAAT